MRNRRGFTIIELLVVISVIAIIVGIVIPRFKGMQDEARKTKVKAELKTLQTGVESWRINHDSNYPAATVEICGGVLNNATPLIVSAVLMDPFSPINEEYQYRISENGSFYVILSLGENGVQDITGIGDDGLLEGPEVDDIYVTNGPGF